MPLIIDLTEYKFQAGTNMINLNGGEVYPLGNL